MDSQLLYALLTGFIRHALTTVGGALVANGVIAADQQTQFVGIGMAIVGFLWSAANKRSK